MIRAIEIGSAMKYNVVMQVSGVRYFAKGGNREIDLLTARNIANKALRSAPNSNAQAIITEVMLNGQHGKDYEIIKAV